MSLFGKNKANKDGIASKCKCCNNAYQKKRLAGGIKKNIITSRKCRWCEKKKLLSEFTNNAKDPKGKTNTCVICSKTDPKCILYRTFLGIKSRCYCPTNDSFKWYGAKGVTVCEEWLSDYTAFYKYALNNGWVVGRQAHRKDDNRGYEPGNVVFIKATDHGRLGPNAKLKKSQVSSIKKRLLDGESTSSVAKAFNVTIRNIQFIKNGRRWSKVKPLIR